MSTHPLLAMARTTGNPVIESDTVTFIWQGRNAPHLIGDFHNWEEEPQIMLRSGSDLWSYSISIAADAYIEYAFIDPSTGEHVPDPLNQNRVWNGVNAYNNYFYMPRMLPSLLTRPVKGVSKGVVTKYDIATKDYLTGNKRTVYLYAPPVKIPVPLMIVFDGSDYLKRARLNVIIDNLIATKRVRPFAMALLQNGKQARSLEYSCSESLLGFVFECVISLAQEQLILTPPGGEPYGVLGASLGGLMAMYTGMRLPQVFGKVISQSGVFILPEHQFVVVDLVRYVPSPKLDIWMDAGYYDRLLDGNRQMYALLKEKEYKINYHEYSGGHNFTAWRNDIWRGLEALFKL
jgi:enterochelin esterase-like enzyme